MADARAGYADILDGLFPLYPSLAADGERDVRVGYQKVAALAHGWYMRVHRGAQALLVLDEAGYSEEAAGIRRSMIEHVLALHWLAAEGDSIDDTVARGHGRDAHKRGEAVSAAGWTSVSADEVKAAIASVNAEARDASNDNLLHFASRAQRYGDLNLMPGYLAECARVHPSYESAIAYVELHSGELLPRGRDAVWQVPFATTHLLEALIAVREIFESPPWERQIEALMAQYRAVTDAVRAQDGLPAIDWPAIDQADEAAPGSSPGR